MGIGDKQRIKRERREKYADAMQEHFADVGGVKWDLLADVVIELVDAEVEALQEQIERDGERIAALMRNTQIVRRIEGLIATLNGPEFAHHGVTRKTVAHWLHDALTGKVGAELPPQPEWEQQYRTLLEDVAERDQTIESLRRQVQLRGEVAREAQQRAQAAEALLESLPREIVKNSEIRGDLIDDTVLACAAYVSGTVAAYKIQRDHGVKEPEYTYAHMRKDTGYVYVDEHWDTVEAATDALQSWISPSAYVVVRRPKPQDWEEVQ